MKYLLIVFLICVQNIFAQEHKQTILRDYLRYSEYISNQEIEKAVEYIHEGIFQYIPKQQMIEGMKMISKIDGMTTLFETPKILEYSAVQKINGVNYVIIQVTNDFQMKMKEIEDEKDLEEKNRKIATVLISLEEKFGKNHVTYFTDSGFFRITSIQKVIANSIDLKNWKFITYENNHRRKLLEQFLPKELLD